MKEKETTKILNSITGMMNTVSGHNLSSIATDTIKLTKRLKRIADKLEKTNKELQTAFDVSLIRSMKIGNEYQKLVEELKKKNAEIDELRREKK